MGEHSENTKRYELVEFGKYLRQLRISKGYSQEEFSLQVGFSRSFYGAIERGEKNATLFSLLKISDELQVPIGDLFLYRDK